MAATITPEMIKEAIRFPNSITSCGNLNMSLYTRTFNKIGKTLIVMARQEPDGTWDVRCWDWLKEFKFKNWED